uniref:Peroxisomal sarcosine oxidase n=1 Tax=Nothoprocta perdicaria TaxID=30464 RepID=A0A8C6ZKA1_NOTPE
MAAADEPCYDAIVIGAGIQGSFAAYHLAERGRATLLLEQFPLPHSRGSSHGQSRIIRSAHVQQHYARMMPESYRLWQRLEARAGTRLYRQTGLLVLGAPGERRFEQWRRAAARPRGPPAAPSPQMAARKLLVLFGSQTGTAQDAAERIGREQFLRSGGVLRDGEKVLAVEPGCPLVVSTAGGRYRARRLVVAAGAWSRELLEPLGLWLPLQVTGGWGQGGAGGAPSGPSPGALGEPGRPPPTSCTPQVCYHHGSPVDPDQRDLPDSRPDVSVLRSFVRRFLPALEPEPALLESCLYTNTPDEDFILDRHPKHSNIVIGAGFSGHGFKLAPVVGKLLCELSLGEEPSYSTEPFRIGRFPGALRAAL